MVKSPKLPASGPPEARGRAPTPGPSALFIETTYKWGQLWTADVTAQLYHSGRLVTSQNLGSLTIGHHGWKFSHHAGRYSVRVCGTHRRRSATAARACITRRYGF